MLYVALAGGKGGWGDFNGVAKVMNVLTVQVATSQLSVKWGLESRHTKKVAVAMAETKIKAALSFEL